MSAADRKGRSLLEEILRRKEGEISARKRRTPLSELKAAGKDLPPSRDFLGAITGRGSARGEDRSAPIGIRLIAEIKKASPSQGLLREEFDPQGIARAYAAAGAAALSILTDFSFFQGSLSYLREARGWVDLPLLQKDFILEEYQLWEGRVWGADAILLIASHLESGALEDLCHLAREIGLEPLIEIHHRRDLPKTLRTNTRVIGINNRDLRTFQVDLGVTLDLVGEIPPHLIKVSESGISSRKEVVRLEEAGLDAILVGEALMRSQDPGQKARELLGRAERPL